MLHARPLTALAALAALASTPAALAAEWRSIPGDHARPGAPRAAAEAFLGESRDALGLRSVTLRHARDLRVGAHHTARFAQEYRGLPVLGASIAVRLGPDGRVKLAVLDVARDLALSTTPRVDAEAARRAVRDRLGLSPEAELAPVLAVLREDAGRLVYLVDARTMDGGRRCLVDATDGRVIAERPLAVNTLGRVYPISSVVTPETQDVELADLDEAEPLKLNGWSGRFTVTNYASGNPEAGTMMLSQDLGPSAGTDFLYDPPADPLDGTDAFAQVGIYYHLTRVRDFFVQSFELDMNDSSWGLVAAANVKSGGMSYNNAFFSSQGVGAPWNRPNLIAIGQGSSFDFADDSDVFLHEFTHYVSSNAVGYNEGPLGANEYGVSTFGGSIDEGLADYFACTVNGDPTVGEASLVPLGAARDLTDTHKVCPDDLVGEVHYDGELIGSLTWSIRETFGASASDLLIWGGMSLLEKSPSLSDLARGLQQTCDDLIAEGTLAADAREKLDALIAERGLDDCDHVLSLGEGVTRQTIVSGFDVLAQAFGGTCASLKAFGVELQSLFHFAATPAPGDTSLRFQVDLDPQDDHALDWAIYARAGQHVGFSSSGLVPQVSKYDYKIEGITETSGALVIDATSDPPFDPSQTYYMVLIHQNCPVAVAKVTTGPEGGEGGAGGGGEGGGTTEAGVGGGGAAPPANEGPVEVDDGCGCRAPGGGLPGSAALLAGGLAIAAAAARRRSKRA
jgi:Zn-dependent metalloprotease